MRPAGPAAALVLVLLLLPPALPAPSSPPFTVSAPAEARIDTGDEGATFWFNVTNAGSELDYVSIPRMGMTWTSGATGTTLGYPSPEFGVSLAPGETKPMWAHVDLPQPRAGTYEASIPFKSERTGVETRVTVRLVQEARDNVPSARVEGMVRTPEGAPVQGAQVDVLALDDPRGPAPRVQAAGEGFGVDLAPGRYAIRVDAPGRQGAAQEVALAKGSRASLSFVLPPATWRAGEATVEAVDVGESVWLLAGSADLSRVATAPMVHKEPQTQGAFVGVEEGRVAWRAPFAATDPDKQRLAGPFQALDTTVAVSPDGTLAAGMDWNGRLHLVDARTGQTRWTTDRAEDAHPLYPPQSPWRQGFYTGGAVAFSPDGSLLAAGGSNGWTVVFRVPTGEVMWSRGYGAEVRALRFTPDGRSLAAGSGDWALHLVDAATGEERWAGRNLFWPFFFVAMDPQGRFVGAGGKDGAFTLWDADDGTPRWTKGGMGFVTGGGVDAGGNATFSDWTYGVHSYDAEGTLRWFRRASMASVATTPDGRFAFVAEHDPGRREGRLLLLDATGTLLWEGRADVDAHCQSDVSPFPRQQLKSVAVAERAPEGTVVAAAACIGGTVFRVQVPVEALPQAPAMPVPTSPAPSPTPPAGPTQGGPPSGSPTPTSGSGAATPLPAALVLAAACLGALALRRRGPR